MSKAFLVSILYLHIFLRWGVVSTLPNPQAGRPPLVGCLRLLIQYICSYPPYWRLFLHQQPEDVPCRGDRDPLIMAFLLTGTFSLDYYYCCLFTRNVVVSNYRHTELNGVRLSMYMLLIFLMFNKSLDYELFLWLTVQNFSLILGNKSLKNVCVSYVVLVFVRG